MDYSFAITIVSSSVVAAITFLITKRQEMVSEWQKERFNNYKALVSSIPSLTVDSSDKEKAKMEFELAVNTVLLFAPQSVMTSLIDFCNHLKSLDKNRKDEKFDILLEKLLLEIRKDIGLFSFYRKR